MKGFCIRENNFEQAQRRLALSTQSEAALQIWQVPGNFPGAETKAISR
jgi:hypothetical protein